MNEENIKIAKIKKSCHAGKIAATVLSIIAIVGCVMSIVGAGFVFSMGREFDDQVNTGIEQGILTTDDMDVAASRLVNINVGKADSIHSDIPALQNYIDEAPYAFKYGTVMAMAAVVCAVAAVLMKLTGSVFGLIETEETPFTDKVIKRVTLVLGIMSFLLLATSGAALGIIGGLVTWVVYNVLDYGKTLQIQADETL
jgi:hypothetical protein